jgi:mono/diheme cytochrome c family protein
MEKLPTRSSAFKTLVVVFLLGGGVAFVAARPQSQPPTSAPRSAQSANRSQVESQSLNQAPTEAQPQTTPSQGSPYRGMGTVPTKEDMGNLAFAAGFKGKDLPEGSGTAKLGADIFAGRCSMCHGPNAEGVHWEPMVFSPLHGPRLEGGNGVPIFIRPPGRITTLAYSAPSPMVLFDTIAVEMPMFRAGTLKPDQVYSLTAFILFKNGIVKEDDVMNRETLPKIEMPNRNAFPASDDVYMDMSKRGCYQTYGVCLAD